MPPKSFAPSSAPSAGGQPNTDEMCPVCKTIKYLNKSLTFLINPACYHPMCTTCVDRLFSEGPAQCPFAGCTSILRRKGFRSAFFGDLAIEREVDIRRRVASVFNKRESDFESLRDYNDYLEMVETMVWDLTNGSEAERAKAEGRLMDWERQHKEEIEAARRARGSEKEKQLARLEREKEEHRRKRLEALAEDAEERKIKQGLRNEVLDTLANSTDAEAGNKAVKIILKKRGRHNDTTGLGTGETNLSIRGLKKPLLTQADRLRQRERDADAGKPYSPFQGVRLHSTRYEELEEAGVYRNADIDRVMGISEWNVPGYNGSSFFQRTMFDAFSGLGLVMGDEDEVKKENEVVVKKELDDVFG